MKRNTKMAVVLSALVALTMAFAGCGKNDSSSKADTSSAASSAADSSAAESKAEESKAEESKAEESKAEESKAEESQAEAAPAESEADAPADSEAEGGQTESTVDIQVLTENVWTTSTFLKEDKTPVTPDEYAEMVGVDVADIASNMAFSQDGMVVFITGGGVKTGTYTADEKNIVVTIDGQPQKFEMAQNDGQWFLAAEVNEEATPDIKGTLYATNSALTPVDMFAKVPDGEEGNAAIDGGEEGAEGEEAGAEGEEAGAEGEEAE